MRQYYPSSSRRATGQGLLTRIRMAVPKPLKFRIKMFLLWPLDVLDRLRHGERLLPPRALRFVGRGEFTAIGEEYRQHFLAIGGLQPDERVLDIGCGVGRMALPLTGYLRGSYEGFDIVPEGIHWCRRNVTPDHPAFRFHHVDLYNGTYNPAGRLRAETFRFPFAEEQFNFAFATSVFSHLQPPALENYLRETARVLDPGGRFLFTGFLLDGQSRDAIRREITTIRFRPFGENHWVADPDVPENAVAQDRDYLVRQLEEAGLRLVAVHEGSWRGQEGLSFQDLLLVARQRGDRTVR